MLFLLDRRIKTLLRKGTRIVVKISFLLAMLVLASTPASAYPWDQYASTVLGFSSQYSTTIYSADQALGIGKNNHYGDDNPGGSWQSWSPRRADGLLVNGIWVNRWEYISLGFSKPVFANGVTIRETCGNGFVYEVDVLDTRDVWHTVWSGTDPSKPGTVVDFLVSFSNNTNYLVDGVRIRVDTNSVMGRWELIDSVQLHGTVPESGSLVLLALGLLSLAGYRLRRQRHESKD